MKGDLISLVADPNRHGFTDSAAAIIVVIITNPERVDSECGYDRSAQTLALTDDERTRVVSDLMTARRAVKEAAGDQQRLSETRKAVDTVKTCLSERGPVWWTDGASDYNRHLAGTTHYADSYRNEVNAAPMKDME